MVEAITELDLKNSTPDMLLFNYYENEKHFDEHDVFVKIINQQFQIEIRAFIIISCDISSTQGSIELRML